MKFQFNKMWAYLVAVFNRKKISISSRPGWINQKPFQAHPSLPSIYESSLSFRAFISPLTARNFGYAHPKIVHTQQDSAWVEQGFLSSKRSIWPTVFWKNLSVEYQSQQERPVTFPDSLFVDIHYQLGLWKQVDLALFSAQSEQSINSVGWTTASAQDTPDLDSEASFAEPSEGTCHFESFTNIFNTVS